MTRALIDIGLPVFNSADSIDRTIRSVRSQTFADFRLSISDNASTDGTPAIIEKHAAEDPRIRFVVQETNKGAHENFRSLLHHADADFFAFVASDDWWSPDFLRACHEALASDPAATCCVPRTAFYSKTGEHLYVTSSTSSITEQRPKDRVERYLIHPSDCSRFYGLHRRSIFSECFDDECEFHAGDWYIMLLELLKGTHIEVPYVLLHRTAAPPDRYVRHWTSENAGSLLRRSPLLPMRRQLKRKLSAGDYRGIRKALLRLDARLGREHRAVEKRARSATRS